MIGNTEFLLLAIIALAAIFFANALRAKEIAVSAAVTLCKTYGVQFLDGTAVLKSLRLVKTRGMPYRFHRRYEFDYSEDGHNRKRGEIIMFSHNVERASLWLTLDT